MHLRLLCLLVLDSSFLFTTEYYSIVCMYQFIHSSVEGHFHCFQLLNKAAVNVCVQVFVGFTFPVHLDDLQGEQRFCWFAFVITVILLIMKETYAGYRLLDRM